MSEPIIGETSLYKIVDSLRNLWARFRSSAAALEAAVEALGEIISASVVQGSAVALTTAVAANVTSISLPPGEWDVSGSVHHNPAATTNLTLLVGSVSLISATIDATPGRERIHRISTGFVPGARLGGESIGPIRLSLAVTTTVYLVARADFSVSTCTAFGVIRAHRAKVTV